MRLNRLLSNFDILSLNHLSSSSIGPEAYKYLSLARDINDVLSKKGVSSNNLEAYAFGEPDSQTYLEFKKDETLNSRMTEAGLPNQLAKWKSFGERETKLEEEVNLLHEKFYPGLENLQKREDESRKISGNIYADYSALENKLIKKENELQKISGKNINELLF